MLSRKRKDVSYNDEDQSLKMYLRGRPIILAAPSDVAETYDINKIGPKPEKQLELEWVYGYRGRDCRSNLYLLPTGELVYFVASVAILHNVEEDTQRHYIGHTDDIKSLAIHPNNIFIATGQCAGHDKTTASPHIRIWDSSTLETLAILKDNFINSIACLSFSKVDDGSLLVAVDESNDHTISVWRWEKNDKITETRCSTETINVAFHPQDENVIVTCGKSHVAFWTFENDSLSKKAGIFGSNEKPKFINCLAFLESGDLITGDSNGNLAIWERGKNTIANFLTNVHDGSIFSICVLKNGNVITGGGKDAYLRYFDQNMEKTEEVQIEGNFGGIRVIAEGNESQLFIGTTRNCILQGNNESGFKPFVIGHSDELWGLAVDPTTNQFVTAGQDKRFRSWDVDTKKMMLTRELEDQAQSVAFSPDGAVIAVGFLNGKWLILNGENLDVIEEFTDGDEPIQVIQYAPNGCMVAIGSRDNHVYLYEISDNVNYSRLGKFVGHSSYITHIDWSSDSQYIRTNSGDYELLYWSAETHKQITRSSSMNDVEWATNTCTITFNTVGIWPPDADGTDINACDRSHNSELLASVDDFGKVNLYSYPVMQPEAEHYSYGGHSSHVTNVSFLKDDSKLITIGGKDTAILQWNLV